MESPAATLLGIGVYSVSEVAALTSVPARSIRRWSSGYRYSVGDHPRVSPPVWGRDIPDIDGHSALSFLDMMEVRFIRAFRQHRVSWAAIREAAQIAYEMFDDRHPFTRARFRTDGRRIFKQVEDEGRVRLFDLNRRSWVFTEIVEQSLYRGVEYEDDQIAKWFPLFPNRAILIDPSIAFGRPVTSRENVPTDILAAAAEAHDGAIDHVAKWYEVAPASVRAALEFERRYFGSQSVAATAAA